MKINVTSTRGNTAMRMEAVFLDMAIERNTAEFYDRTPLMRHLISKLDESVVPVDHETSKNLKDILDTLPEGMSIDFDGGDLPPTTVTITLEDGTEIVEVWDPGDIPGPETPADMDEFIRQLILKLEDLLANLSSSSHRR
jgi:hypothetical protein